MEKIQRIAILFAFLFLLLSIKSFAAIDQTKVADLENATFSIKYVNSTCTSANLYISNYDKSFDNYEYITVLTNGTTAQPKISYDAGDDLYVSDIGLLRYVMTKSTDDFEVPADNVMSVMVEKPLELSGDIRAWVFVCDSGSNDKNIELVRGNILISRPNLPNYMDRFTDTFFYSNDSVNLALNAPRDAWTERTLIVKIGEIKDYDLLNKIKTEGNGAAQELYDYAKTNKNQVLNTKIKTPQGEYQNYISGYTNYDFIPDGLNLENKIEQNNYYYILLALDDENGKYEYVEAVNIFQAENTKTGQWALFKLGSNNFDWDNLDHYREEPKNTIPEEPNNVVNNEIENNYSNNIVNNSVNNIINNNTIDNSISDTELPYTGMELTALYIVFILLCVIYRKYKKIKNL